MLGKEEGMGEGCSLVSSGSYKGGKNKERELGIPQEQLNDNIPPNAVLVPAFNRFKVP